MAIQLNPEQEKAAHTQPTGVLLVEAGAGSGKTTMLKKRVNYILKYRNETYEPTSKLLVMAFNKDVAKAIDEHFERVLNAQDRKRLLVKTFHGMATYMLFRFLKQTDVEAERFDIPKSYHLYQRMIDYMRDRYKLEFTPSMIKLLLRLEGEAWSKGKELRELVEQETRAIQALRMPPEDVITYIHILRKWRYQTGMLTHNDTLPLANSLPAHCFARLGYKDILADELQDLNYQQREFVKKFMAHAQSFTGVGDANQSIFGFAGSDDKIFTKMREHYPDAEKLVLAQNYRSTEPILKLANLILEHELESDLRLRGKGEMGAAPQLYTNGSAGLVEWLRHQEASGIAWKDIGVLYRTRNDSPDLELALVESGIPYVLKDNSFFEDPVVQDMVAYMNLYYHPQPHEGDWRRIFNHFNGLGWVTATQVWEATDGKPLTYPHDKYPLAVKRHGSEKEWDVFYQAIQDLKGLADVYPIEDFVEHLKNELVGYWEHQYAEEGILGIVNRIRTAETFVRWVGAFKGASGWDVVKTIEDIERGNHLHQDNEDAINVLTVHKSKGLEYQAVGLWNVEDGRFPLEGYGADPAEERRLLYVAVTRAMKHLALFCSGENHRYSTLSKYLPDASKLSEAVFQLGVEESDFDPFVRR